MRTMIAVSLTLLLSVAAFASPEELRRRIESSGTDWVAYEVPVMDGTQVVCSSYEWESWRECDRCLPSSTLTILYNVRDRVIRSVRVASPHCQFDRRTETLSRLENVDPAESRALLAALVDSDDPHVAKRSIHALALHVDSTEALIGFARRHPNSKIRGQALFWMGSHAGRKAAGVLRDAVDNDPNSEVRTKAVFGLSMLPNDQSIPVLIELMHSHRDRNVRKKAAFWLGQKNDPRALDAIEAFLRK